MDEKLKQAICKALFCVSESTDCIDCELTGRLGQAFLDAGWRPPQEPAEGEIKQYGLLQATAKRSHLIREGELALGLCTHCPDWDKADSRCSLNRGKVAKCQDLITLEEVAKAQLAHDKQRMVSLPSDMEKFRKSVGYIIVRHIFLNEDGEACLGDYDVAKELLELLKSN